MSIFEPAAGENSTGILSNGVMVMSRFSRQKNGPPLAQGARRGVLTPSGLQQGAGERIPAARLTLWHDSALLSSRFD